MLVGNIDLVHAGYYVIMSVLTTVTGDSTTALRLPSVIAIGLTAGLVTLIGRRLFDTPVGVLAGLVFALSAVYRCVSAAQEARWYTLVTLVAVAATWLFRVRWTQADPGPRGRTACCWCGVAALRRVAGGGRAPVPPVAVASTGGAAVAVGEGSRRHRRAVLLPVLILGSTAVRAISWVRTTPTRYSVSWPT